MLLCDYVTALGDTRGVSGTTTYGREQDGEAVTRQPGQVVVVSGDSGIGKSTFLTSLYESAGASDLAAHPVELRALAGSLQRSLAESLGEILHRNASEQPTFNKAVWGAMKDVVARASSVTGRQVGELLIGRAFEYVETKLGKDVTKVIRATLEEALQPVDVGLESQLARLTTPDIAEQVAQLAGAIAAHSGRRLLLLFDAGERLSTEDQALLVELSRALPGEVRVVVAINSHDPSGATLIRTLGLNDVVAHELLPLGHEAVTRWLDAEEVASGQRQAIDRLSNGYPLFIAEALRLIREGATLDDVKTPPRFELLFDMSWQRLGAQEQLLVTRLAGFGERPSDDFLADYLGFSALELSIVERRLVYQGIFIRRPGGSLWFHERRRQYIWRTVLTDRDRAEVAADAYSAIATWIKTRDRVDLWVTSTTPFVARALPASGTPDYVGKLLGTTLHQLSILWSALEICEPGEGQGLLADTDEVVRYAGIRSGVSGDSVEAVRHLTDLSLVVVATNDYASVLGLVVPSLMDYAALLGEIELRFRTRPIPRLASTAFDALVRPQLGKFETAVISVGEGSLTAFKAHYVKLTADNPRAPFQPPPALALALKVDGHSLGVTATFDDTDYLSDALARMSSLDVEGARVEVVESHLFPPTRVRYGRYERLVRCFDKQWRPRTIRGVKDLVAALDERTAVQAAVVASLDPKDASALGFRDSQRYLLEVEAANGTAWTEFEVAGASTTRTGIVTGLNAPPLMRDPLRELRLRSSGMLAAGERLRRWTTHFGKEWEVDDPVRHLFDAFCDRGRAFNKGLPRAKFVLDADVLTEEIRRERDTRNRLVGVIEGEGPPLEERPVNDSILLALYPFALHGGYAWGATTVHVANGASEVHVRVMDVSPPASTGGHPARVGAFDVEESLVRGWGDGYASSVLANLLGYVEEDIQLVDPRFPVTTAQ